MQRTLLAAIVATLAAATVSIPSAPEAQRLWSADYFPNLPVVTQDGKTLRFYDDLIKDKIVLISFIYTSCPDICPLTTARLAQVEEQLGAAVGRDIFFYSITVDPENDSPERLKEFAEAFGAGPGWSFLTGNPEDIRAINYKLGDRGRKKSDHRNEIVLGNDVTGEWARDTVLGDLNRLLLTIRDFDPKLRDPERGRGQDDAGGAALLPLSPQPGQAMFKKLCAPCHTIGVGDRVGPDLRGVTERRERTWLASFIRNPARMRAQQDAVALELAAKYPRVHMPALGISEVDATDLVAYLEGETARLSAAQTPSAPNHDHANHHHQ